MVRAEVDFFVILTYSIQNGFCSSKKEYLNLGSFRLFKKKLI